MTVKKGDLVLGEYKVISLMTGDAVFQWARARSLRNDQEVLLQLLLLNNKQHLAKWVEYFDALGGVSRKSLHLPTQVLSDAEYPLVMVYPLQGGAILEDSLQENPSEAAIRWHQASEAINILHNRGLIHGGIMPKSFVVSNGEILMTGFGYGPLPTVDADLAQKVLEGFLAPEIAAGQKPSKFSDIYAFAKVVAHWRTDLTSSSWFQQATNTDPSQRFQNIRGAAAGLEKALTASIEAIEDKDVPVVTGGQRIVPKFALAGTTEPPEGGEVQGLGHYRLGHEAELLAIPALGWCFEMWSVDIQGDQNPVQIVMDANKAVVAHFARERPVEFTLKTLVEPSNAGEVIGGGRYFGGTQAAMKAIAKEGWSFIGWRGDMYGAAEQSLLLIDGEKSVVATFQRVSNSIFSINADPPEGGQVLGGGVHTYGEHITIRAVPSPLWRFLRWSGDENGTQNPITVRAKGNLSLVAHFGRSIWEEIDSATKSQPTREEVNLIILVQPPQGGSVLGAGSYGQNIWEPVKKGVTTDVNSIGRKQKRGISLSATAKPNPGWRFHRWVGDVESSDPYILIEMNEDKVITAHFQPENPSTEPRPGGAFTTKKTAPPYTEVSELQKQTSDTRSSLPRWATPIQNNTVSHETMDAAEQTPNSDSQAMNTPKKDVDEANTAKTQEDNSPKSTKRLIGDAFRQDKK